MKHYIQYDAEYDTLALYRLYEGKRIKITNLSEEDLDAIEYQYKHYKRNKAVIKKFLTQAIDKETDYIDYVTGNLDETELGKELLESAQMRINYLKGELEDDRNGKDITGHEGRVVPDIAPEEEGIGRSINGVHP
jgi:hypothetical protein